MFRTRMLARLLASVVGVIAFLLADAARYVSGHVIDVDGYEVYGEFDPPIVYDSPTDYGADAAIFHQHIGAMAVPMSKGVHTLSVQAGLGDCTRSSTPVSAST